MLAIVVHPDPEAADTLYRLLGVLGWDSLHASTGEAALELLAVGHRPAAVVCAAELPDWDARGLLHEIKQRLGPACVIATAALEGRDLPTTGAVIEWPYTLDELQEALGEQPSSHSTSSSATRSSTTPALPSLPPSAGR